MSPLQAEYKISVFPSSAIFLFDTQSLRPHFIEGQHMLNTMGLASSYQLL